ncbi:MAG: DNA-directed DNA polymerase [Candidatus Nanoarchaeia archaeon]|nr:DNA-directed DNA polymerase [Candidatus Jingweiarchaeum tengchongense]
MVLGRVSHIGKEGSDIILYVRTQEGERKRFKIRGFRPYFYVPDSNGSYLSIFGDRLRKIELKDPSAVPKSREKFEKHFEADIPYTRRFLIDMKIFDGVYISGDKEEITLEEIKPFGVKEIEFRKWFLDIEVKSPIVPDPEKAEYEICSIAVFDNYLNEIFSLYTGKGSEKYSFENEYDMLYNFLRIFHRLQPDIIVGWNIGFDITYLQKRCKKFSLNFPIEDVEIFDMLEGYRRLYRRRSYKLKSVALEEGVSSEYLDTPDMMNSEVDEIVRYNRNDVRIMVELDKKLKLLQYYEGLKTFTGVAHFEDTLISSVMIDTLLLRLAKESGKVLPSKLEGERLKTNYAGAIVTQPYRGIFENVAVFDMAHYYPSIIISWNLSPEGGKEGIIPRLCKILLEERLRFDREMKMLQPGTQEYERILAKRNAVKYLTNAIYGYMAFSESRMFNVEIASKVTSIAREFLLKASEIFREKGYEPLYSDTDSIMVQIPFEISQTVGSEVSTLLRKYAKEKYGIEDADLTLKFEKYFSKLLFTGVKKKYVAKVIYENGRKCDYINAVGFEAVRTDNSKFSSELQKELFEKVLSGAGREEILSFIRESIEKMKRCEYIDIAFSKTLSKTMESYKTKPIHLRAMLYSNLNLGTNFKSGDRIYILYIKEVKGKPKTDVIAFDEETKLPPIEVDWEKMIEHNIKNKVEDVLETIGISWNEVLRPSNLMRWL